MQMTKEKHRTTVDVLMQVVEQARLKLTESTLPPHAVCKLAIEGIVTKRGKNPIRKSMPVFREHPLGNLLFRLIQFHRSSGGIMGAMMVDGDCGLLVRATEKQRGEFGAYWTDAKSQLFDHAELLANEYVGEITSKRLYDELDTLALVLLAGKSQAADNWSRVMYG